MKRDFIRNNPQIVQALQQARNERVGALIEAADSCEYEPSETARRKMELLIRAQRKPYYRFTNTRPKRALLALAATIILMITMVFSVSALREPVLQFFVKAYEKFSAIFFVQDENMSLPTTIEEVYLPKWLPEGYALDETLSMVSESQVAHFITSDKGDTIVFLQHTLDGTGLIINTEGVGSEEIYVGECAGIYYSNLGSQEILWENDQYGFSLSGTLEKDILLNIALSVMKK